MKLEKQRVMRIIKAALSEDIGKGDITTSSIIPKLDSTKAAIVSNESCIVCGLNIAEWIISSVDYSVRFKPQVEEGQEVFKDKEIAFIEGHTRAILTAERTVLNFLSFLSGIATKTKRYADIAGKYNVKILDTRKTLPLLRYLEKYAVSIGGGHNHRFNLNEMVMVKDNHKKSTRAQEHKVTGIRKLVGKDTKIEIEIESLEEFKEVLKEKPDVIMLDNMNTEDIRKAIDMRNKSGSKKTVALESSGGITLENLEEYAKTGVDMISVGELTDSVESIDFSLNLF